MFLEISISENFFNYFNVFLTFDFLGWISAIVEMLIIAAVIYEILMWIKNTRAYALLRGLIVIICFIILVWILDFTVILYILKSLAVGAFFAIIIVFQDDLRSGLEHLGRQKFFAKLIPDLNKFTKKTSENIVQEIVEAAFDMGKVKTGALIVMEQGVSLEEYERTGIAIDGKVTKQLLINIFEKNTPLHDGAVLIVGDLIKAATCYLPLSHDQKISKEYGTRHRAALGISEVSDSMTIVVSEENGKVSLCYQGKIEKVSEEKELMKILMDTIYKDEEVMKKKDVVTTIREWFGNDK